MVPYRSAFTAVSVLLLGLSGTARSQDAAPRPRVLKVFLADFDDVPHPESYTSEYFHDLFFGRGVPRLTPEGRPLAGSVREYFLDLSVGRIDIVGDVADWVRVPRRITGIPHWKRGMKPFGESWPVIVAETLRANGITGADCREKLRLGDGRLPELLVFLNTDWGVGAVNRGWDKLKDVLQRMGLGELWDEHWTKLPSPYSCYSATIWRKAPRSGKDGTINRVPPAHELELFPLSITMHEMGHQLAGFPDLYGPSYAPWGVFDLMAGPAARTHFPMGIAAFQRERKGWMAVTDVPRTRAHRLVLRPLDSHREAFRLRQGPGQESMVVENRACLRYPRDYSQPPADDGPRLIIYRYDPNGRAKRMSGSRPIRRITSMLRRGVRYGEVWGEPPFTALTAATKPWSRNSLGELWWEVRTITPRPDRSVTFDAGFAAIDLVADFHTADWRDQAGEAIRPGAYGSAGGHVAMRHGEFAGPGTPAKALHCRPVPGGSITGRYTLTSRRPSRLYLVLSRASTDGPPVTVSVVTGKRPVLTNWVVGSGDGDSGIVLDVLAGAADISVSFSSPEGAESSDGIHIREGWLVDMPSTLVDLAQTHFSDLTDTSLPARAVAAFDGFAYGPHCVVIGTTEAGEERPSLEFALPDLPTGADVRALIGLTEDTSDGAEARVSFEFVVGDQVIPSTRGIRLRKRPPDRKQWPDRLPNSVAVVEASVPAAARGESGEARLRLTVEQVGEKRATVVLPCLRITGD